jgi:hypothetical protein
MRKSVKMFCGNMGRITTTIPDNIDEEMRKTIIELVGIRNLHGSLTKFIAFAIERLVQDLKRDESLKGKLLEALQK